MRDLRFRCWYYDRMVEVDSIEFFTNGEIHVNQELVVKSGNVMMFTGLKDRNGKYIFDGDLLRYPSDDNLNFTAYEVFFHDGDANSDYNIGYSINRTHFHGNIAGGYIPSFKPKTTLQMVVIGNIYSNPELLK